MNLILHKINNPNNNNIVIIFTLQKCPFYLDLSNKLKCKNIPFKSYFVDNFFIQFTSFIHSKFNFNFIPIIFFNKQIVGNYYDSINFFNL